MSQQPTGAPETQTDEAQYSLTPTEQQILDLLIDTTQYKTEVRIGKWTLRVHTADEQEAIAYLEMYPPTLEPGQTTDFDVRPEAFPAVFSAPSAVKRQFTVKRVDLLQDGYSEAEASATFKYRIRSKNPKDKGRLIEVEIKEQETEEGKENRCTKARITRSAKFEDAKGNTVIATAEEIYTEDLEAKPYIGYTIEQRDTKHPYQCTYFILAGLQPVEDHYVLSGLYTRAVNPDGSDYSLYYNRTDTQEDIPALAAAIEKNLCDGFK